MGEHWRPEAFVGGHVALDFTNTVGGHQRERVERLESYAELLSWARVAEVVDDVEIRALTELAAADPDAAERALDEARAQREALHRWLAAPLLTGDDEADDGPGGGGAADGGSGGGGDDGGEADRARVARDLVEAHRVARLSPDPIAGPAWLLTVDDVGLALPARRLALATAALLASDERHRIGLCGRCSWLFLDPSPSRRRRWCSMATCGNRAKAARHHARGRPADPAAVARGG